MTCSGITSFRFVSVKMVSLREIVDAPLVAQLRIPMGKLEPIELHASARKDLTGVPHHSLANQHDHPKFIHN